MNIQIGDLVKLTKVRIESFKLPENNLRYRYSILIVVSTWLDGVNVRKEAFYSPRHTNKKKGFMLLNCVTGKIESWYTESIEKI